MMTTNLLLFATDLDWKDVGFSLARYSQVCSLFLQDAENNEPTLKVLNRTTSGST
jgi:hypothetical protein